MAIQHGKWTQFIHEEKTWRARMVDYGYNYAAGQLLLKIGERKKFMFFGPTIPVWKVVWSSGNFLGNAIDKKDYYNTESFKNAFIRVIISFLSEETTEPFHEDFI